MDVVVIVPVFERHAGGRRMVPLEVAVDDVRMTSVLCIPRMDVLGRQEQHSQHTECGENSDDLSANAGWHHLPLSGRVN